MTTPPPHDPTDARPRPRLHRIPLPRLERPRSVVTGGGSGLGRALTMELVRRGGRVVLADVDEAGAAETAQIVRTAFPASVDPVLFRRCDVRDAAAVEALADFADGALGGLDLVANNAGVAVGGRVGETSLENWRFCLDVNLWGVVHGCHAFVPRLRRQGGGFVLNVASAAGLLSPPDIAPYNVAKAGVVALSETLHAELAGTGIGVSVLCPTFFRTNILASARGADDATMRHEVERRMDRSRVQAGDVARAALRALERGRLYVLPMADGRVAWRLKRAAPGAFHRLLGRIAPRLP